MNEEEKKIVEHLKKTSKDRTIIPLDDEILIAVNLIEKLQKENEELKEINNELEAEKNETIRRYNFETIPIKKVKDKIEGLNSRIEKYREYVEQGIETNVEWVDNVADRETVKVLQELIEEREEK